MKPLALISVLCLVLSLSSAQVLEDCQIDASDKITQLLPNYTGTIQPCSYSGFAHLDQESNKGLFYWYIPNLAKDSKAPVIVWLQGGAGLSSLFSCLVESICPFSLTVDSQGGDQIVYNPETAKASLAHKYNVLLIDGPLGTGYSYSSQAEYPKNSDESAEQVWSALQHFLTLHPEVKENEWYFAGESHAAKYLPALSLLTLNMNNEIQSGTKKDKVIVPLKALMIGSPLLDGTRRVELELQAAIKSTILAPYQYSQAKTLAYHCLASQANNRGDEALDLCNQVSAYMEAVSGISSSNIQATTNKVSDLTKKHLRYLDHPDVQKALHATHEKKTRTLYSDPNGELTPLLIQNFKDNSIYRINKALSRVPILFFGGNFDTTKGQFSEYEWLSDLEKPWSNIVDQVRGVWSLKGIPVGFWTNLKNLTLVTITNAGSMTSYFKPEVVKAMIDIYTTGGNWDPTATAVNVTQSMCKYMNNCNGNGECLPSGVCRCKPGFFLEDCSLQPQVYNSKSSQFSLTPRQFLFLNISLQEGDHFITLEGKNVSALNVFYSYSTLPTSSEDASGVSLAGKKVEGQRRIYLSGESSVSKYVAVTIQNEDFLKPVNFKLQLTPYNKDFQTSPSIKDLYIPLTLSVLALAGLIFVFVTKVKK